MSRGTKKTQITHLLGNPDLTHEQIAGLVGCSTKTIQRTAREIEPDLAEVETKLAEYQRLLRKRLPIQERVELYEKIARKAESNPFAALRALERADALDGILTARDEIRKPFTSEVDHRPLFSLPPGTHVNFGSIRVVDIDRHTASRNGSTDQLAEQKTIDITPVGHIKDPKDS